MEKSGKMSPLWHIGEKWHHMGFFAVFFLLALSGPGAPTPASPLGPHGKGSLPGCSEFPLHPLCWWVSLPCDSMQMIPWEELLDTSFLQPPSLLTPGRTSRTGCGSDSQLPVLGGPQRPAVGSRLWKRLLFSSS